MTEAQAIAERDAIDGGFQQAVDEIFCTPDMDRSRIDAVVIAYADILAHHFGRQYATYHLGEAASGLRSGLATMRVHHSPSISFLIARLEVEASSLEGTTKN